MEKEKQRLSTIIKDLKTKLDTYQKDALQDYTLEDLLQITDIYKAAYGKELDLHNVIVD